MNIIKPQRELTVHEISKLANIEHLLEGDNDGNNKM